MPARSRIAPATEFHGEASTMNRTSARIHSIGSTTLAPHALARLTQSGRCDGARRERPLVVVSEHTPKASNRSRARLQAARALGERKFEQAQAFSWVRYGLQSFEHEQRSGAGLLAGGLAYRFFFWLVSFGLVLAATASFWVRSEGEGSLTHAAKNFGLSGVAARSAAAAVHDGSRSRWYFLIVGVVLMIYFGTGGVRALRVTAIIAWRLDPTRMRHAFRASTIFTAVFALGLGITIFASWERHQS